MILHTDYSIAAALVAFFDAKEIPIQRAYQTTNQGVPSTATLTYFKVSDKRHGSPFRSDYWDELTGEFVSRDEQTMETIIQIGALAPNDTASDMLNNAAILLATEEAINYFLALDIGIQRITEVRNPYFVNDSERFESSPSFDFTLNYRRGIIVVVPAIETYEAQIKRV